MPGQKHNVAEILCCLPSTKTDNFDFDCKILRYKNEEAHTVSPSKVEEIVEVLTAQSTQAA